MGWIAFVGKAAKQVAKKNFKAAAQRYRRVAELMGENPQRWVVERWADEADRRTAEKMRPVVGELADFEALT